jgi:vacuolar-type H+-ATPase subunit H
MADNKKIYSIQINGIDQSIKQVDALSDALQFLDKKIKELESRSVSITSSNSGGSSRNADLQTEDKLLKQIQQTEQQIRDARREDYASLLAQKDILKDIVDETKQRAAQERLSSGNYGNTMKGLKQELSDIKSVMQTTDLGDEKFQEMTQRANELTNKLKELEQAYGQFGRNVGNYKSAFDDVKKITVQVGSTAREFNSVRDASRQLEQEFKAMVIAGKEGTKEYKELADAIHNFEMASRRAESAVNDLKASSQGMDDMLDMMESFGSMGQVTQGFSAFFGFDDTEIERSIQKLVGLQNAMQGIEKIRQQLNTGEGIGAILSKGNDKIDAMAFRLKRMNVAMLGTGPAAKVAAVGIKALSTAIKGMATLGLAVIIDLLVEGITKLSEFVTSWVKGDADLISSTSALNSVIQKQNEILDKNLDLIQKRQDAGELSALDARIEKEKAFAKALLESRNALNAREKSYQEADIVQSGKTDLYLANAMGDKGVTSLGGFSEGIKSINEFADRFDYLLGRVQNGQDIFGGFLDTEEDARDELVHITKLVGGDFINAMNKFADGTEEGSRKLAAYIVKMDELTNGKYSQAIKLGIDEGYLDGQFKQSWELYQRFKKDVALDPIDVRINFENLANQFIEAADKTKTAYYQRMRDQLDAAWNALSADEQARQKETYDKARAAIDKQQNETRKSVIQGERRTADERRKKLEAAEKELNSLRIAQMKEGLNKTIKQLEEERRQKLAKAKQDGIKVGEITEEVNKLYDKKVEDAKKQHAKEVEKIYTNMWRDIFNINYDNSKKNFEIQKSELEKEYEELKEIAARNSGTANQSLSNRSTVITKKPKSKSKEGSTDPNDFKYDVLIEKEAAYTQRLMEEFKKRTQDRENYYAEIQRLSIEEENKRYELETANAKTNYDNEKRLLDQSYQDRELQYKDYLQRGVITQAEYNEISKKLEAAKESQLNTLQKTYQTNSEKMLKEHNQRMAEAQNQSNEAFVQNVEELLGHLSNIDFSQLSKKQRGLILNDVNNLVNQISSRIEELESELKSKDLTKPQREQIEKLIQKLKELKTQAGQTASDIDESTNEELEKLIGKINSYVQALGQSLQSILDAVWSVQDAAFDKEMDELDKTIDAARQKYQEMDELANEHKSTMEGLEDDIANAQGDARDHLIQRYNAEKEAMKQALNEKKKAEKEEEKLQAKKEKMEIEQKKREKKRNLVTAAINTAMAISMAAVNNWPVPAIPMMAAAAVAGAAQIAAIASQNYAHGGQLPNKDGGVAQGNRHRDGGIKVLGGHAEIEGGEFVTNRLTTSKNIDLLEYINSKKKRININDLIEFYGGDSPVKKNIQNVRTRFAEGGVIPTLATVDTNDRLLTVIEDYSNRPVQVAVVDIIDRTEQVNNVKVIAGLDV